MTITEEKKDTQTLELTTRELLCLLKNGLLTVSTSGGGSGGVLGAVRIYTEGKTVVSVSTDSFRLLEQTLTRDQDQAPFDCLIPAETVKAWVKLLGKPSQLPVYLSVSSDSDSDSVTLTAPDAVMNALRPLGGPYPNYRSLLPTEYGHELAAFNPAYLATLGKIQALSPINGCWPARLVTCSALKPSMWILKDRAGWEAKYLVMPMRVND